MKSKKLISLLCAAAMSASAFAGLTVTASAATPVYTFDGSDITGFSGNGTLAQVSDDKGEYFSIKANGSSTYSATLTLPADAQLTSADGYTIEYDARLHKSNGMGRYGRYTQVAFIDSSNAAKDSRDYGPYGALFSGGNSSTETGQGYTAGVASSLSARYQLDGTIVNDPGTETLAADNTSVTGIADDMWVRVQTYVKGDVAKVTVIDVNNNKIVDGVDYINSAILLLVAVCCVYPFLYVFFVATTDGTYLARGEMTFLPMGFNLKAFGYILTNPRFNVFGGMRNSFMYTLLGTLLAVACTYVTAYVLSRPRFKHRFWLMSLFIITWVFDAGIIPQYIIYNQFGFVNNPWVMIVPGAISTQFLIITKTFLEGIPNELEEAAVVDGATDIKILTRIFLPLSPTVLATTGLFYAVSIWNQYLVPQIYLKDDGLKTIQQVLKNVVITDGGSGTTFKNVVLDGVTLNQQNLKAAAIFIAMLPIICVYPFVQKYFKKGILIGSVKG